MKRHIDRRSLLGAGAATLAGVVISPAGAQDVMGDNRLKGAGSTFVYPVLARWSREYSRVASGYERSAGDAGLNSAPAGAALGYEPVGSLAGMLRLKAGAVDFAASDVPLGSQELARLGFAQFPIVIGGIVAVVSIEGVAPGVMKLSGPVLADIFLGKISNWSDPAIGALNPELKLPDAKIAVVRRSDGSGTTFNFTDYLSKVSPQWKQAVGSDLLVKWPIGSGAKGNDGIAQAIRQTRNSIGYLEYSQALQAKLSYVLVQNRAGNFVVPGAAGFQAAAGSANWAGTQDFSLLLTDVTGPQAYPLVATVFVLMSKSAAPSKTRPLFDLFQWSLEKGAAHAAQLGYVPLPASLVELVKANWARSFRA